jgi:hypothetical protein
MPTAQLRREEGGGIAQLVKRFTTAWKVRGSNLLVLYNMLSFILKNYNLDTVLMLHKNHLIGTEKLYMRNHNGTEHTIFYTQPDNTTVESFSKNYYSKQLDIFFVDAFFCQLNQK